MDENEPRKYFLYLKNEQGVSVSTFQVALSGIRFFYQHTLKREWTILNLARPSKEKRLPVVLKGSRNMLPMGGRYQSESVDDLDRNRWTVCVGLCT